MYDYVIVGGGSAGCVLANRLSTNPDISVCLLEAGPPDKSPFISIPLGIAVLIQHKAYNWMFNSQPEPTQNNREIYCPRGKTLGGSSSINAQLYIRGQKSDYDQWASLGNKGWGWDDVLPYFKRHQNQENGASEFHGVGGELNVADQRVNLKLGKTFLAAARQAGHRITKDFNGAQQEGCGYYQVTQKDGKRWSAANAFLHPVAERSNLTVMTGAQVQRVEMKGQRATGVTLVHDGKEKTLSAKEEVILSAGSFQSPQLLMLSGIGPKSELERHNIPVKHELAGVGQNLQEHCDVTVVVKDLKKESLSALPRGLVRGIRDTFKYLFFKTGIFSSPVIETGGFIKSSVDVETPDLQLQVAPAAFDDHGRNARMFAMYGYSCHVCYLRPKSRGQVGLHSNKPLDPPRIQLNMLADDEDMEKMVVGVKKVREILNAPVFQGQTGPEVFPGNEVKTDDEIKAFLREKANHVYHPVGTCKMGADPMAVVDDQLRVHGMEGLRVVDASIMPTLISGNTNAPTMMIAEKAANMILGA